ncbi:MAG: type II secretion system F family protein [Pseudomonadales bacterium]
MAQFAYVCRNSVGIRVEGILEASNEEDAAGELMQTGMTPISIQLAEAPTEMVIDFGAWFAPKVHLEDLILFSRQMYSLSKAGIPMIRALSGLADSTVNTTLAKIILEIQADLESGQALSRAMARQKVFSELYVAIIHVGENTGRLDEAFAQIAEYLELERETIKRIKSATRYPTFVIAAMGIGLLIINVFVIPAFSGVFEKLGADLPWQTQVLVGLSNFMLNYWYLLLFVTLGAVTVIRLWLATPEGLMTWHRWKLKLPVIGSLFERIHLGRFCRSFAMILRSGLPIVQGLNTVSEAVGNDHMAKLIRDMRGYIERGGSFLQSASQSGLFTPLVLQMISVGEETGAMDEMLAEAADFYEQEVDYDLKSLADAIEPILIIGIGAMILVLALGVFLPLWDLSSAAAK